MYFVWDPTNIFQVSPTLESIWGIFFAIIWYLKWTLAVLYNIGELPSRPKDRGGSMVMMTTTTGTNICQKNCETNAVTLRFALANICKWLSYMLAKNYVQEVLDIHGFGVQKNPSSSKLVQRHLVNQVSAISSKNCVAKGSHYINSWI